MSYRCFNQKASWSVLGTQMKTGFYYASWRSAAQRGQQTLLTVGSSCSTVQGLVFTSSKNGWSHKRLYPQIRTKTIIPAFCRLIVRNGLIVCSDPCSWDRVCVSARGAQFRIHSVQRFLTEMSPGLLGIKTRPQLNKISLSLLHKDPCTHI